MNHPTPPTKAARTTPTGSPKRTGAAQALWPKVSTDTFAVLITAALPERASDVGRMERPVLPLWSRVWSSFGRGGAMFSFVLEIGGGRG